MTYEKTFGPALVIQHTGQIFPLTQEAVTIGRGADNTLVLADPRVSSHHATIFWQSGLDIFIIQDLASTNGTFVNEERLLDPQPLRHGDTIRTGNTVMDVKLAPAGETAMLEPAGYYPLPQPQSQDGQPSRLVLPGIILTLLAGITVACLVLLAILFLGRGRGVPNVIVQSPPDGANILAGNEIILQAVASGTSDITLLELRVDDKAIDVATSPDPRGSSTLTVSTPWTFSTPGGHVVSAVAYTATGKTSRTESIEITAIAGDGEVIPVLTPTTTPIALVTPTLPASATPDAKPGAPSIEYFRANPEAIGAGECTTLEWGKVDDATQARIDPGIGGVATPGSRRICPGQTTTYVLTATGPGGSANSATTVTVSGALANLMVDSVTFDPNPPVKGQNTEVTITIRNVGAGQAGPFSWDWRAGEEASFDGRLGGLEAGQTTVVSVRWRPANAYDSLSTVARVDIHDEVPETDTSNNRFAASVEVIEDSSGPGTVTLRSDGGLDGYRGNSGGGGTGQDIIIGNGGWSGPTGEKVWRGFMSFDLSSVPRGASIRSAELRFFQVKVEGAPYQKLGNLILDHVDYGSKLSRAAYDTPALGSAGLTPVQQPGAWYSLSGQPVTAWISQDLAAGRGRLQLRMRWLEEKDGDDAEDYASMEPGNNYFGTGNVPALIVSYGP